MTTIARLKELHAKATPGPWVHNEYFSCVQGGGRTDLAAVCYRGKGMNAVDNLHLIAAMHAALPAILDALEAAKDVQVAWKTGEDGLWLARMMEAGERLDAALAKLEKGGGA